MLAAIHQNNHLLKVVDSCRIFSTKWSDTFTSFFCMWKGARILKKYVITVPKKNHFPKGFDSKDTIFEISGNLIRKACFHMTLNTRKS